MAYSRKFQTELADAVSRARWRAEVHQRDFLPTAREKETATIGDMSKTLIVTYDLIEKLVSDILAALDAEMLRRDSKPRARKSNARRAARGGSRLR
ncbi:MAG: hypothetical protein HY070_10070 [Chloroflexi bacterium]|nr:hypothetical protein [Chloroflexota bacterium]